AFVAGCIVLPACIIGAVLNPFCGRIYDTIGPKIPVTVGVILILIDLALEMLFMVHVSAYTMMAICVVYCVGQSLALGNTTTFALRNLPGDQYGDGTAVINTLQQLFGAIGTAVASTSSPSVRQQCRTSFNLQSIVRIFFIFHNHFFFFFFFIE
ncbi:MAG: MFS transporter, partial [Prevotella sp.]